MNDFERQVRATVFQALRDTGRPPSPSSIAGSLGALAADVTSALHSLADQHRLVLRPGTDEVWMAHPFSAIPTDFVVRSQGREWFANCAWDGLAVLALVGDGTLTTRSPATGEPIMLDAAGGLVRGEAVIHFLVPPRRFWDDIGFT